MEDTLKNFCVSRYKSGHYLLEPNPKPLHTSFFKEAEDSRWIIMQKTVCKYVHIEAKNKIKIPKQILVGKERELLQNEAENYFP